MVLIWTVLQRLLVHRLARAAGYLSTLTGNVESGQNVSWPVITRVNIGDDAELLRRIDVSITSFAALRRLITRRYVVKIFRRMGEANISSLDLGTRRGNIDVDAAF